MVHVATQPADPTEPGIHPVVRGVHRIPLSAPFREATSYVLESIEGLIVMDPGWHSPETERAMKCAARQSPMQPARRHPQVRPRALDTTFAPSRRKRDSPVRYRCPTGEIKPTGHRKMYGYRRDRRSPGLPVQCGSVDEEHRLVRRRYADRRRQHCRHTLRCVEHGVPPADRCPVLQMAPNTNHLI